MQKLMGDKGVCVGGSMFFSIDPKDLSHSLRTGLQCSVYPISRAEYGTIPGDVS